MEELQWLLVIHANICYTCNDCTVGSVGGSCTLACRDGHARAAMCTLQCDMRMLGYAFQGYVFNVHNTILLSTDAGNTTLVTESCQATSLRVGY